MQPSPLTHDSLRFLLHAMDRFGAYPIYRKSTDEPAPLVITAQAAFVCTVVISLVGITVHGTTLNSRAILEDGSVIVFDRHGYVEPGTSFEMAELDIRDYTKLVLPTQTQIRTGGQAGKIQIYMRKTLTSSALPWHHISIRNERSKFGWAVRTEGHTLHVAAIATGWDWSNLSDHRPYRTNAISLRVLVIAPNNIVIETNGDWFDDEWLRMVKLGHWKEIKHNWQAVPTVGDPSRRVMDVDFPWEYPVLAFPFAAKGEGVDRSDPLTRN